METLEECLSKKCYSKYWTTLSDVSSSLSVTFQGVENKVFDFELFCSEDSRLEGICKVDAIALKKGKDSTSISLLEFKGGNTVDNWNLENLVSKAIDTFLCGFQKFVNFDRCSWFALFHDSIFLLNYYIIISDIHVIAQAGKSGYDIIRQRTIQQKGKEEKSKLNGKLKRYGKRQPFDNIEIIISSDFLNRVNRIVGL